MDLRRKILLGIVALSVALPAVPAFADNAREGHRVERQSPEHRQEHRDHKREARRRRERRDYRFAFRGPYEHCFTRGGYWTSDGWQRVWVPPERICR